MLLIGRMAGDFIARCTEHQMMNGFMMQNMMMQTMMQNIVQQISHKQSEAKPEKQAAVEGSGFSVMGIDVPAPLLQKILNIDASPEDLRKLQTILDGIFKMIPEPEK